MLFNIVTRTGSSVLVFGGNWKNVFDWMTLSSAYSTLLSSYTTIIDRHDLKSSQHIVYHPYLLLKLLERYYLLIWSCRWGVREITFRAFPPPADIYWLRQFYQLKLRAPAPLTLRSNVVGTHRCCLILRRVQEALLSLPSVEIEKMSSAGWMTLSSAYST